MFLYICFCVCVYLYMQSSANIPCYLVCYKPWMPFLNHRIVECSNPLKGCSVWHNHIMIPTEREQFLFHQLDKEFIGNADYIGKTSYKGETSYCIKFLKYYAYLHSFTKSYQKFHIFKYTLKFLKIDLGGLFDPSLTNLVMFRSPNFFME